MRNSLKLLSGLLLTLAPAVGGTISLSSPLTDDASTGISTSNTYTHAVSGGTAATVNGVNFAPLNPLPAAAPANFSWISSGDQQQVLNNNGQWVPANGGVTGAGLLSLLGSFTYSGSGAGPGSNQTFTLSGLTIGTTYDTRLYIRVWDPGTTGRPIDLVMTHGAEANTINILEDRPQLVLGSGTVDQAYYINYRFTAQGSDLAINAAVPAGSDPASGSFHMYALSNQVVPEPATASCLLLALGLLGVRRRR